VIQL